MRKIISSMFIIVLVASLTVGATRAYFSDTATSTGNRILTGSLDLNLDGQNANVVKFSSVNILPGDQPVSRTWAVHNAGSIAGYLDLHGITKTSDENDCTEPEGVAGDTTCGNPGQGNGELLGLLHTRLFLDADNDGVYDESGDTNIYEGLMSGLGSDYNQNIGLAAQETKYITMTIDWPSSQNDVRGQSDSLNFDMTFELAQTQTQ